MADLTTLLGILLGKGGQPSDPLSMLGPAPSEEPRPWYLNPLTGQPYQQTPQMREEYSGRVETPMFDPAVDVAAGLAAGAISPAGIAAISNPRGHLGDLLVSEQSRVPEDSLMRLYDAIQAVIERFPRASKLPKDVRVVPRRLLYHPNAVAETEMWPLTSPTSIKLKDYNVITDPFHEQVNTLSHELTHVAQKDLMRRSPSLLDYFLPRTGHWIEGIETGPTARGDAEGLRTILSAEPYNIPITDMRGMKYRALSALRSQRDEELRRAEVQKVTEFIRSNPYQGVPKDEAELMQALEGLNELVRKPPVRK